VFNALLGQFRGGPAIVTVLLCAFFTSFTGASGVTILALGGLLMPVMMGAGYSERATLGLLTGSGGLGLLLVERLPSPWMASCIVGALCLLCGVALRAVPTPVRPLERAGLFASLRATLKDLWEVMRNRAGLLAFILCFLPIATGAAPLPAVAGEWQASANTVALIAGVLGGVISAAGCMMGGWFCDRMDRKAAYVWFGLLQAAAGGAMALLPRTQAMFIVWGSVYTFTAGLTYAAFSAFVLEAIGKGAAATKYNALASLSNVPIYYMINIDGWAHDRWNSTGMFFTESGLAVAAAVVFVVLAKVLLRKRRTNSIGE